MIMIPTVGFEYWAEMRSSNIDEYQRQKERITDEVVRVLEKRFGDVRSKIEMTDVSTPSTVFRYTQNWKGSFEGWLSTPAIPPFTSLKKQIQGLDNFYMVGHWVEPGGGLPNSMLSGRNVTQVICRKDKKRFVVL